MSVKVVLFFFAIALKESPGLTTYVDEDAAPAVVVPPPPPGAPLNLMFSKLICALSNSA